jgi:hypothetical protein
MIELQVWKAARNSDLAEGRGYEILIGYFKYEDDAKLAAKGWGVMGVGDGNVAPVTLRVYDSLGEFSENETELLKNSALAKLTHQEKQALGLI